MELIKWMNYYSVKNTEIDNEHKHLIGILNHAFEVVSNQKPKEEIIDVLDNLLNYTNFHFKHEEDLFEKYNYPNKDKHLEEHKKFTESIEKFENDLKLGRRFVELEIFSFLKKWLYSHITKSDKEYSNYFRSKKIEGF